MKNVSPKLSIVIVSYNTRNLLLRCIDSIYNTINKTSYEIIVIDNASNDQSSKAVKDFRNLILVQNKQNIGFAKANNQGLKLARGQYILLLNSDTELTKEIIAPMIKWLDEHQDVGICTCKLIYPDGSTQATGGYFPTLVRVFSWMIIQDIPFVDRFIKPFHPMKEKSPLPATKFYNQAHELDWVTGAFFLMKRQVYDEIGPFDEDYFMYTEETDYCFRAKAKGWKVWYLPHWSIIHIGGASGTRENSVLNEFKGIKLFYKKHYPSWQYPILRLLLKTGALIRISVFGILEGSSSAKIYAKAFKEV